MLELDLLPQSPGSQWHPVWRQLPRVLLALASDKNIRGRDLPDGGWWLGGGQSSLPALLLQRRSHGRHAGDVMRQHEGFYSKLIFQELTEELGTIQVDNST